MARFPAPVAHGPLTTVVDGIACVRGGFRMGPGITIGRTMTVVTTDDGLVVLNAVRLTDEVQAQLDALGKVKHLVKLSDAHSVDEPFYVDRYGPVLWSLPGADMGKLSVDRTLGPDGPIAGAVVVDYGRTVSSREAAYQVPMGGGTLVTCDAIQNCVDKEGASFGGGLMTSLMGFKGGVIVPPMWRRFQKVSGAAVAETLSGLTELSFENLVSGHGPPVVGGADALVHAAIVRASA